MGLKFGVVQAPYLCFYLFMMYHALGFVFRSNAGVSGLCRQQVRGSYFTQSISCRLQHDATKSQTYLSRKRLIENGNRPKSRPVSMTQSDEACESGELPFTSEYHTPVLCNECVEWLVTDPDGAYVDGTLGGGGHSLAVCEALAALGGGGRLWSFDRDPEALATATARLEKHQAAGRWAPVRANFGGMGAALAAAAPELFPPGGAGPPLAGMLLDLGVSSHQLDEGARGFSYAAEGPLDMRMEGPGGGGGLTAEVIVNTWEADRLADVLWSYGDERRSRRIARNIVDARPLATTRELAAVARRGCKSREEQTKTLARVFQALRIAVNGEMEALESVLTQARQLIKPGGRIVVLSYHSLEDRRVKRILNDGNFEGEAQKDFYGNRIAPWNPVSRKAMVASKEEVEKNSRARSVKMRVAIRTDTA